MQCVERQIVEVLDQVEAPAVKVPAVEAPSKAFDASQRDRRIGKSRRALRGAMISLVAERGFDAVTVNDLCERADLNRGTFYNHFKDKENLASSLQDEFFAGLSQFKSQVERLTLKDLLAIKVSRKPLPLLVDLFDYLRQNSEYLVVMLGPRGDGKLARRLRDTFCRDMILGMLNAKYRENPTALVDYYVAFYASAYMGVICHWLSTGMKEPSDEMAMVFTKLLFIKPGESITM